VLPPHLVPDFARRLLDWHVANTGDPLMNHVAPGRPPFPAWFRALVLGELLLQVPFFFVAIYAFARRRNWIRLPALAYGVHTATTLLPILLELAESPEVPSLAARVQVRRSARNCARGAILSQAGVLQLLLLYAPYLLLPLVCALWMASSPQPFVQGKLKSR